MRFTLWPNSRVFFSKSSCW